MQYILKVEASDNRGEGMSGSADVIIKVTDSNDHAPVFLDQPVSTAHTTDIYVFNLLFIFCIDNLF